MIIYTKYSNERRREFCIRTDIRMNDAKETYVVSFRHSRRPKTIFGD